MSMSSHFQLACILVKSGCEMSKDWVSMGDLYYTYLGFYGWKYITTIPIWAEVVRGWSKWVGKLDSRRTSSEDPSIPLGP